MEILNEDELPDSSEEDLITDIPRPTEIKAILDQYVIGQELAKKNAQLTSEQTKQSKKNRLFFV